MKLKLGFIAVLTGIMLLTLSTIHSDTRAFLPSSGGYVSRLRSLVGWSSRGYYSFNCSGYISNAHGEDFINEQEMFAGANGKLDLLAEVHNYVGIDYDLLLPGDVAAFAGPGGDGLHVAAYLGDRLWTDSDCRRGSVATYHLPEKSAQDIWFAGHVRLYRWRTENRARFNPMFFTDEQSHIGRG